MADETTTVDAGRSPNQVIYDGFRAHASRYIDSDIHIADLARLADMAAGLLREAGLLRTGGFVLEWGVRTTATMPGILEPETRVHPCKSREQAESVARYYRGHYSQHPRLNGTADLVSRMVGPWEVASDG